jgi:hypothetical protein
MGKVPIQTQDGLRIKGHLWSIHTQTSGARDIHYSVGRGSNAPKASSPANTLTASATDDLEPLLAHPTIRSTAPGGHPRQGR